MMSKRILRVGSMARTAGLAVVLSCAVGPQSRVLAQARGAEPAQIPPAPGAAPTGAAPATVPPPSLPPAPSAPPTAEQPIDEAIELVERRPDAPPAESCSPACRAGHVCQQGTCVSACNPPCLGGTECTAAGTCESLRRAPDYGWSEPGTGELDPAAGVHTHDGFLLHFFVGFGSGTFTESISSPSIGSAELEFSGFAGSFTIDIGGGATDELSVAARLGSFAIVNPSRSTDGQDFGQVDNLSISGVIIAPVLTYNLMPVNVFFSLAVGASRFTITGDGDEASSDYGVALNVDAGKDWWVGDQWGLGVAARLWYSQVSEGSQDLQGDLDLLGFAVAFSATYQ